jgi:hypothetical protein
MSWRIAALAAAASLLLAVQPGMSAPRKAPVVRKVGGAGNEPIITRAPDGTLYVSALQYLYVSTNNGTSWSPVFTTPPYASTLNVASDSSIAVDPGNRLYFTFDWPYAGGTAVCTSDDRGRTWACQPEALPGGTDRMWVVAPTTSLAYLVTNEGLEKTVLFTSTDRGTTWIPAGTNGTTVQPQDGALLKDPKSSAIVQPVNAGGKLLYVWTPGSTTPAERSTNLVGGFSLPSAAFTTDGTLYLAGEARIADNVFSVAVARTKDLGVTWTRLPPVTGTTDGTATFSAVAAGRPGDVGVLFYSSEDVGEPAEMSDSTWDVKWARSRNANSAHPTWTVTTLAKNVHKGVICAAATCSGNGRFAGDFVSASIDGAGTARVVWMNDQGEILFASP